MSQTPKYTGLTASQVAESRAQHGANVLTPAAKDPWWKLFLQKFKNPLIIILLVAGCLSIGISCYEFWGLGKGASVFFEPIGIFIAILLATGLAFFFEAKADKEFAILNQVNDDEPVQVIRDGVVTSVPRRDIVVGDIIQLNTGDEIPADARLLEATSLSVDESTLTGEPLAHKTTDLALFDKDATFPSNEVMRGTKVMEGHAIAEVTAVGDATENGKVFEAAQIDNSVKTPLDDQMERLGTVISRASYVIGALIIGGRILMYFTANGPMDWATQWSDFVAYLLQTIMIAVTLIVVSVPEGLPMAVTLSLAYSMRRMLKTNNLVRKLHACETMGATTVICTDKTGTLTQNQMRVYQSDFYGLQKGKTLAQQDTTEAHIIAQGIAVNSTAQLGRDSDGKTEVLGNPTEGALLLWLKAQGEDYTKLRVNATIVAEVPFSTERKYMATEITTSDGQRIVYVKGAPEIVFGLCRNSPVKEQDLNARLASYQAQAMRTLGFAYQILADGEDGIDDSKLVATELTFLGIVAISDPVRDDVPAAIKECQDAGINIKIVTGDTPGTAREIGRQIGLYKEGDPADCIITGPEFGALSEQQLDKRVLGLKIIARARPMDKKRLVEALQRQGQVVAVTGDGTNDAPALKAAHVGLSMGDGTSVAKEASDITIIDNSFTSIGRAVMWGRSLYQNIRRFILFQMTVNVAACLIVLFGAFMGTESPLTVTQMLWVNLIMDTFAAMALASLPPSETVMKDQPRRRSDFIISASMWKGIIVTGLIFFGILLWLVYAFEHTSVTSLWGWLCQGMPLSNDMDAGVLSPYELSLIFTIFVFLQFWNMFNARAWSTHRSALHLGHCSEFILIAACIFVGQILIVEFGSLFFNVTPLSWADWLTVILGTSLVLWIGEGLRLLGKE